MTTPATLLLIAIWLGGGVVCAMMVRPKPGRALAACATVLAWPLVLVSGITVAVVLGIMWIAVEARWGKGAR